MATLKSTFINMLLTLGGVTLVAAVALGFVYKATKAPIEKAALAKQLKAIESVIKGYDNNPVQEKFRVAIPGRHDSLEFFPATANMETIGVAVKTKSAKGYSGDIWIMVGFEKDGTIADIFVVQHLETPGLGSKMSHPFFLDQYRGKHPARVNLKVKKDGGTVDAISGATISSRAFSEAVLTAYETFEQSGYGKD
jgi:Na+-translocating ferredoxin:NAD+ oxidoreductase subunit G